MGPRLVHAHELDLRFVFSVSFSVDIVESSDRVIYRWCMRSLLAALKPCPCVCDHLILPLFLLIYKIKMSRIVLLKASGLILGWIKMDVCRFVKRNYMFEWFSMNFKLPVDYR